MKDYSFANVVLLVNGVPITGWDEGDDVINIERFNDSASHVVGAGGEMVVSMSADRSGQVRFRLQQTSDSNTFLGGLIALQEEGLFVPAFIQFKDVRSGDLVSGTQGYIPRPANMVRGTNAQPQEWQINCENLSSLFGTVGAIIAPVGGDDLP